MIVEVLKIIYFDKLSFLIVMLNILIFKIREEYVCLKN